MVVQVYLVDCVITLFKDLTNYFPSLATKKSKAWILLIFFHKWLSCLEYILQQSYFTVRKIYNVSQRDESHVDATLNDAVSVCPTLPQSACQSVGNVIE